MIHETRKHSFAVADLGDTDNDIDRSIIPSIEMTLKNAGIDASVDGDEMSQHHFTIYTYHSRDAVKQALEDDEIILDE
jgi:hypothetical protein